MPRKRRTNNSSKKKADVKPKAALKDMTDDFSEEEKEAESKKKNTETKKKAQEKEKKTSGAKVTKKETEDDNEGDEQSKEVDSTEELYDDGELLIEVEEGPSDISTLYDIDEDNPVDMTKMDQSPRRRWWIVGLAIFSILLLAIGYFGYRVFSKDFGETGGDGGVEIEIDIDENTASGDLVTFEVEYKNTKGVDLSVAEIELFYPEGFFYKNASEDPQDDTGRIFDLGVVKSGTGGKIEITGQLVGEKGDDKQFSALLTYQPKNFSNDFQVSTDGSVHISSSIITLEADVPGQAQSGQEIEYTLTFSNTAKLPLENVKVLVEYPKSFTYTGASVEPRGTNNDWRIDSLAAGAEESITVRGTLGGESGDTKEFKVQFGVVEIDNSYTVQSQLSSLVVIINPEVEFTLSAPELVSGQEEVNFVVNVKNTSEAELKDVKVKLEFSGDLIKEDSHGFEIIDKLSPFDEKELTYTTNIKKTENIAEKTLGVKALITKAKVEGKEVSFPNEATAEVKLRGSLTTSTEGRYFDDDLTKIGTGPLPPVVNRDTTYVVRWNIANGSNALDDFSMTTTLPSDVIWENDASSDIEYASGSRQVSYSTSRLKTDATKELEFTVTVSPTNDDINKLLVLTQETVIAGTDAFTGEQIAEQLDRVTSDLPNDEGASGKGVVEGS